MRFARPEAGEICAALERKLPLLQVLVGPRQVGKTTAASQVEKRLGWPSVVASADAALPHPPEWIETQWRLARAKAVATRTRVLLVLDEIQKVPGWSEVTKRLWDEELANGGKVRPLLLGSSALLVQRGVNREPGGTVLSAPLHALVVARMPRGVRLDAGPVDLFWRLPRSGGLG